jgi:hypothetical protein
MYMAVRGSLNSQLLQMVQLVHASAWELKLPTAKNKIR